MFWAIGPKKIWQKMMHMFLAVKNIYQATPTEQRVGVVRLSLSPLCIA